ncbi:MAG: hypothetical protein ABIT08_02555 [Bacteroidia bacterium]
MKPLTFGFYFFFIIILLFIPYSPFTGIQRGLGNQSSRVSEFERELNKFDKRKSELQKTLSNTIKDSVKYRIMDSTGYFYNREIKQFESIIEETEKDKRVYEQHSISYEEGYEKENLRLKTAFYYYFAYCLILIFMCSFIAYQFYFNKQFIYNDEHGTTSFFYFLNILLDAILLNETIHCTHYTEINVYNGYLILTLAFILKHLYFINCYHNLSFISNNKKTTKIFIRLFNTAEVTILFYFALSEPWNWH